MIPKKNNRKTFFFDEKVEIDSSIDGKKIDIRFFLKNPLEFHGDTRVHHLVKFDGIFEKLIGRYKNRFGPWNQKKLEKRGIVILEYHVKEARKILNNISHLAEKLVTDPRLYDDKSLAKEYFDLVKKGYGLLRKYERQFGFSDKLVPVSLERAGIVCTRLAKGLGKDARVEDEVRVVTKRTHLKDEPGTHLAVSVMWRDKQKLKKIRVKEIELNDTVNPASGASGAAFVISSLKEGVKPSSVLHRSIVATRQGLLFIKKAFEEMKLETKFYSLGESNELNKSYYLVGNNIFGEKRIVADAGHILRHFLPNWYKT